MKRSHILLCAVTAGLTVSACDSLKEAFTAHVDQVARAAGQELSTERLAKLIGTSSIPARKDVISTVADFWVSYQLLGYAGAHGDSLNDPKLIDAAMWEPLLLSRTQHYLDEIKKKFPAVDTTGLDAKYAQGTFLAAQHILILMPQNGEGMSKAKQDSIRNRAESIRAKVTTTNFDAMVKQYTEEPQGKEHNGSLGVFPAGPAPGSMVPEFEAGVRALKPGEVSPQLVKTSYGYHIIRRNLLPEVRAQFIEQIQAGSETTAREAYLTKLRTDWKVAIKPNAGVTIKKVATDLEPARTDKTVIATSRNGDFTAARLAQWIEALPPQSQVRERMAQMPDTAVVKLVSQLIDQEIMGAEADKAKFPADSNETKQIRIYFTTMVNQSMQGLRVDPTSLGDSAKTTNEKEHLAAVRVNDALDRLFTSNGQNFIEIAPPLAHALRSKYSSRINTAGVDRAVDRATAIRATVDSAKATQQQAPPPGLPPGAIPVPVPPGASARGGPPGRK